MDSSDLQKVIKGGFCIGCGACTQALDGADIRIEMDKYGRFQAKAESRHLMPTPMADSVCPFSSLSSNEDKLSEEFLKAASLHNDPILGRYMNTYVGRVEQYGYWKRGSSGGFTSWLLANLLTSGRVDGIVHVKPCQPGKDKGRLFEYAISTSVDEIHAGAKSHYYPIEMSKVLSEVRGSNGRYAFVGIPCFIKALRLLAKQDDVIKRRIQFSIGLFCGHLKSTGFAELLAWQCGIMPHNIKSIDFRKKVLDRLANEYHVSVRGSVDDRETVETAAMSELIGSDWGMGFFKYKACDYCDDISAETADVSIGDAWLPEYTTDSRGTNIIIVRNSIIQSMLDEGCRSGDLDLAYISPERVKESQSANIRHRIDDLPYRLYLLDRSKIWRPKKRIIASRVIRDSRRKQLQVLRLKLRDRIPEMWFEAKKTGEYHMFRKRSAQLIKRYQKYYNRHGLSLLSRGTRRAKTMIYSLIRKGLQ